MSNLNDLVEQLVKKANDFRPLYEQNEMAVREQIVNPVLRCLEWDPENPSEVQPNVPSDEGGVPDYSLMKEGRKELVIEVKKLGVDVEHKDVVNQIGRYCYSEGTKYGLLTNGLTWLLIRSFEEGKPVNRRIVWKTMLDSEKTFDAVRKLSTISKTNLPNVDILVKKHEILDDVWGSIFQTSSDAVTKALTPVVRSHLTQKYPGHQFDDTEIEGFLMERIGDMNRPTPPVEQPTAIPSPAPEWQVRPRRMKIGGNVFDLHASRDILIHTAEWLIKNKKLRHSDCPVHLSGKRHLIHSQPEHPHSKFFSPKKLSNGLFIETNYSTVLCKDLAKQLLGKFGVSSALLSFE